jgi:flavodoxin
LVVGGFDGSEELESAEVFEGVETVEGEIDSFQIFVLCDFLYDFLPTCRAGSRLCVQVKSLKAKVVPQLVLPKLDKNWRKSSCSYLLQRRVTMAR